MVLEVKWANTPKRKFPNLELFSRLTENGSSFGLWEGKKTFQSNGNHLLADIMGREQTEWQTDTTKTLPVPLRWRMVMTHLHCGEQSYVWLFQLCIEMALIKEILTTKRSSESMNWRMCIFCLISYWLVFNPPNTALWAITRV